MANVTNTLSRFLVAASLFGSPAVAFAGGSMSPGWGHAHRQGRGDQQPQQNMNLRNQNWQGQGQEQGQKQVANGGAGGNGYGGTGVGMGVGTANASGGNSAANGGAGGTGTANAVTGPSSSNTGPVNANPVSGSVLNNSTTYVAPISIPAAVGTNLPDQYSAHVCTDTEAVSRGGISIGAAGQFGAALAINLGGEAFSKPNMDCMKLQAYTAQTVEQIRANAAMAVAMATANGEVDSATVAQSCKMAALVQGNRNPALIKEYGSIKSLVAQMCGGAVYKTKPRAVRKTVAKAAAKPGCTGPKLCLDGLPSGTKVTIQTPTPK